MSVDRKEEESIMKDYKFRKLTQREIAKKYHHSAYTITKILRPVFRKKVNEKAHKAHKKRQYKIKPPDNAYADMFRINRACNINDVETWDMIHKIWEKNGYNPHEDAKYYDHVASKRVVISNATEILAYIAHKGIRQKTLWSTHRISTRTIQKLKKGEYFLSKLSAYKSLVKFCESAGIEIKIEEAE